VHRKSRALYTDCMPQVTQKNPIMTIRRFSPNLFAATLLALLFSSVGSAQIWIASNGLDNNPCTRTAPCRTLNQAVTTATTGQVISCVDSAIYSTGNVSINRSLTIDCRGTAAILTPGPAYGIVISAQPGDVVTLRNLIIVGQVSPADGIHLIVGQSVRVENVQISGFAYGISVGATGPSLLTVENTTVTDCSFAGIFAQGSSGNAVVNVSNTRITNTVTGILAGTSAKVTVTGSVIANGSGAGIAQQSGGSQVLITGSTIASMGTAFQSSPGNFIGATGNTVANNGVIYDQNGGQIYTGSDSPLFGNGSLGSTSGAVPKG
jgi:Right handed beta helix region